MKIEQHDIIRLTQNDSRVQKAVFERLYPILLSMAKRYSGDDMMAEDAVTTAFIIAFKNVDELRSTNPNSFFAWLKKIVINQVLSDLRKNKKYVELDIEYEATGETDDTILSQIQSKQLLTLIDKLPVNIKTVFLLFVVEDYTHSEISAMLNISESNSKVLLHRAKNTLKNWIQKENNLTQKQNG